MVWSVSRWRTRPTWLAADMNPHRFWTIRPRQSKYMSIHLHSKAGSLGGNENSQPYDIEYWWALPVEYFRRLWVLLYAAANGPTKTVGFDAVSDVPGPLIQCKTTDTIRLQSRTLTRSDRIACSSGWPTFWGPEISLLRPFKRATNINRTHPSVRRWIWSNATNGIQLSEREILNSNPNVIAKLVLAP